MLELAIDPSAPSAPSAGIRERERAHARVLALYVATGLVYMVGPGTFLGVWNLLEVSARHSVSLVSPAWLQAHGHALVFGWVATFILGIGFYSIPLVNAGARPSLRASQVCWALWTTGVGLRWAATVYAWHWRALVPLSAVLEVAAFAIFFRAVSQHNRAGRRPGLPDPWVRVVMAASMGMALTLLVNLYLSVSVAWHGISPAVPHGPNQKFLVLVTWGFLAPFVWAFSTKWLPVLLGLRPTWNRGVMTAVALNTTGVLLTLAGLGGPATVLFVLAAVLMAGSLRLFERPAQSPRTRGVHHTFPLFVRMAYGWLIAAAVLGAAAALWDGSGGIWGASRHAFTVGFVAVMVFSIGQRVLPAFAAMGPLWSPRLMFTGLLCLVAGCLVRVPSEIFAYQIDAAWAWAALPVSAVLELSAVIVFAINLIATVVLAPAPLGAGRTTAAEGAPS